MATPFIAEIRIFSFSFPPRNWAQCNGQLLAIAQNQALFSLVGTLYGGNGTTNFGLPNFQGRSPMHWGQGPALSSRTLGETGGTENVTLLSTQMPQHNHLVNANSGTPTAGTPTNNFVAQNANAYSATSNATMNAADLGLAGGNQPHPNRTPYLVVNICIALAGIFPSRN